MLPSENCPQPPEHRGLVLPGSRSPLDPERAIKPGKHGIPPETVAEIQRARLVDGFVRVAAAEGYRQTTISKVTGAAGVTKKAFYFYFPGLDDCFLAAYQTGTQALVKLMHQAFVAAPTWPDGVHAGLSALLHGLAGAEPFAKVSVIEVNSAGPSVRQARSTFLRHFHDFLRDPGTFHGSTAGPPRVSTTIVDAMIGGIYSTLYLRIEQEGAQSLPELLPSLTYFALLPLLGREQAGVYLDAAPPPLPDSISDDSSDNKSSP